MNRRLFAIAAASVFTVLFLNACDGGVEIRECGASSALQKGYAHAKCGSYESFYCGFIYSFCYEISRAEEDAFLLNGEDFVSYENGKYEIFPSCRGDDEAWREEVQKTREDSTRIAEITFSNNRTIIQLGNAILDAVPGWFRLESNKKNDTLHIGIVDHYDIPRSTSCPISLEIALNRIEENIKVVVFEDQVFQVKIQ